MISNDTEHYSRRWTSDRARLGTCAELAALAVIIPEALILLDPRLAGVVVPLLTLVPVLFGLRYGFSAGAIAALLLAVVFFQLYYYAPHALEQYPKVNAAVNLLAGCIAGQCHDHWKDSLAGARQQAAIDQLRLSQFTNTFHVLKASHARLERQLSGNRTSLRCALQRLTPHLAANTHSSCRPSEGFADALLELLAETCHLHAGAVYEINDKGLLVPGALASFGSVPPLSPFNPLLRQALDSASVVGISANDAHIDHIIAVVPLVDSLGRIHGVVTVNQMAFIAIDQHTFDLAAILARRVGDMLAGRAGLFASMADGQALMLRFRQSAELALAQQAELALVSIRIASPVHANEAIARFLQLHRGIDQPWMGHDRRGYPVFVMFLPVPDESAARNVAQRLRMQLQEQVTGSAAAEAPQGVVRMLDAKLSAEDVLALALMVCDLPESNSRPPAAHRYPELAS